MQSFFSARFFECELSFHCQAKISPHSSAIKSQTFLLDLGKGAEDLASKMAFVENRVPILGGPGFVVAIEFGTLNLQLIEITDAALI